MHPVNQNVVFRGFAASAAFGLDLGFGARFPQTIRFWLQAIGVLAPVAGQRAAVLGRDRAEAARPRSPGVHADI